ncbi:MAG TPA: class I SAM-dependent methyltransferase [Actinomycetales bacterium]|nr:class I SAM-dependent methyltransferase [Actinomycetales bacterium]
MSDWTIGNDRAELERQYGTQTRLRTRAGFWAPSPPGESPQDIALEALRTSGAREVLEIGCGRGLFAQRLQTELGVRVLATDRSVAMVQATAGRGVSAEVADADHLPYPADSFDAVVAMWMLYHVPDLDRTLAEVRRVLRPGGVLVAVTNGRRHTADLRAEAGLGPAVTSFMAEDGADHLSRHFDEVTTTPTSGRAVADHATAQAYLSTFAPQAAERLAPFEGTRTYTGSGAVLVAR